MENKIIMLKSKSKMKYYFYAAVTKKGEAVSGLLEVDKPHTAAEIYGSVKASLLKDFGEGVYFTAFNPA